MLITITNIADVCIERVTRDELMAVLRDSDS